jgi:hypothetical protein
MMCGAPAWFAVTVHTPVFNIVTSKPDVEHTVGVLDVNVTGKFKFDDAATVNGAAANKRFGNASKEIVCGKRVT